MPDLLGKMIVLESEYSGRKPKGYVYHVDTEHNFALAFWDVKGWEDKIELTILREWIDSKWCYLTETKGV